MSISKYQRRSSRKRMQMRSYCPGPPQFAYREPPVIRRMMARHDAVGSGQLLAAGIMAMVAGAFRKVTGK